MNICCYCVFFDDYCIMFKWKFIIYQCVGLFFYFLFFCDIFLMSVFL
ncbi:hypothetical protein HMPREF0201_04357 [Cedecea davisae DSM 4568]|uniref:Uncharacterized protein n=1 Tax=Cedecea davisae DSM 4568 TaxID=566551 RepID=S3JIZ5_9ENTR|nr:hypothetical protein HMPREF0201_04357 [Cedecea davisae DSM 4568]